MQFGSMFISNCNNILHVSDAICVHPQEHLNTVQGRWLPEAMVLGRPYWILHPVSCQTPEAFITVFKCS
jgi:hypothetical protein